MKDYLYILENTEKTPRVKNKKCINPNCNSNLPVYDTFCKKRIESLSIFTRIDMFKKTQNLWRKDGKENI